MVSNVEANAGSMVDSLAAAGIGLDPAQASAVHRERPFRAQTERRLVALMSARLALTLVSFGIVLALDGAGLTAPLSGAARRGLY